MNDILEDLFCGKIRPVDEIMPNSQDYEKVRDQRICKIDNLIERLKCVDPSLKTEFMEILDLEGEIGSYEVSQTFITGFRLGARIMAAIFEDD